MTAWVIVYWDTLCHSDQQSLPSSLPVRQRVGLPSHWMHFQTLSLAWRVAMLTAEHTALPVLKVRRVEGDVRGAWLLSSLRAMASCPLPAVVLSNESLWQLSTKCFSAFPHLV